MSRIALACALCLLIAGCAAPTAPETTVADTSNTTVESDATTTTEETTRAAVEETAISVSGGSLPFDHERVFDRTIALMGVNVSPPGLVVVKSAAEIRADTGGPPTPSNGSGTRTFSGVMGIGQDAASEDGDSEDGDDDGDDGDGDSDDGDDDGDGDEGVSIAAYAPSAHSVVVNERMTVAGRERTLERTLAHEFVHNVQFHQSAFGRVQNALGLQRRYSRDRYLTYVSVIEGTAVFVAQAYDDRYLEGDSATITSPERYRASSSGTKYAIARYYFGNRYLQSRFDSTRNVSAVYDDPPRTTEQLLHPNSTDRERILTTRVFPGENRTLGESNTNGELFTRIALVTELNRSRAASAADGWGSDELVPVVPENETRNRSFVWATRWDSASEADEFHAGLRAYLDSRANRSVVANQSVTLWRDGALTFRVVRVEDETVVLLAGNEAFVRDASVSGTNATVSVSARTSKK